MIITENSILIEQGCENDFSFRFKTGLKPSRRCANKQQKSELENQSNTLHEPRIGRAASVGGCYSRLNVPVTSTLTCNETIWEAASASLIFDCTNSCCI